MRCGQKSAFRRMDRREDWLTPNGLDRLVELPARRRTVVTKREESLHDLVSLRADGRDLITRRSVDLAVVDFGRYDVVEANERPVTGIVDRTGVGIVGLVRSPRQARGIRYRSGLFRDDVHDLGIRRVLRLDARIIFKCRGGSEPVRDAREKALRGSAKNIEVEKFLFDGKDKLARLAERTAGRLYVDGLQQRSVYDDIVDAGPVHVRKVDRVRWRVAGERRLKPETARDRQRFVERMPCRGIHGQRIRIVCD